MENKNSNNKNILEVKNVHKTFRNGKYSIHASNDVSFNIPKGKVVGLIGESGSGKTTIGRTIMNLIYPDSGSIKINGIELAERKLSKIQKKALYSNIQMIFQDPYSSLNTQKNIMKIVSESLTAKKMDQELFDEFFKEREKILFFSKYSLRETFFKNYWDYKIFKRTIYIDELNKILEELNNFNINSNETIHNNLKSFYLKIIEKREITHYKVISKLNNLLNFLYKNWLDEKEKILSKNHLSKVEKDYHEVNDKLNEIKNEIIESDETKKTRNKLEESKSELQELILENKLFISTVKKQYKNVKRNLKNKISNLFLDKIEAKTRSSYNDYDFLLLKPKAKIKIIKNLRKNKIYIDLNNILNIVELEHNKILVSKKVDDVKKRSIIFSDKISEIIKDFDKKNSIDERMYFQNLISSKKDEIKKIEKSYSRCIDNDKTRDIGKLKAKENKISMKSKEVQSLFNNALKSFVAKTELKFNNDSQKNRSKIDILDIKLKNLTKSIKLKEKIIIKSILNIKKFNSSTHNSLRKERNAEKNEYSKYSKLTRTLLLEIHSNTKIIKSIKYLYGISKSIFPYISKKRIKEIIVRNEVFDTLEKVGLNRSTAYRYPHEFSGGMRQRVGIARAIISKPKLIIADEPIAALDLSIQAQIVNLLMDLKKSEDLSILFIAHDLSMIEHNSDEVIIMHLGRIVEKGDAIEIFKNPIHPYTKTLINSIPSISKINNKFQDIKFIPNYLGGYSIISKPEFHQISKKHFVFGTKDQINKWK